MEKSMSVWKRLLAVLMVFALVIGNVPAVGMAAEEEPAEPVYAPAALTTSVTENQVFALNVTTTFTYGTVPNDDDGKMVKGRFEITNEDGSPVTMAEVAKLEYLEVQTDTWFEFYGDFGPVETGFPMMEATSSFRITFKQAGTYKVTVSMVSMEDGSVLCSDVKTVKAEKVASTVAIEGLGAATAGRVTAFSVTTKGNSEAGTMVLGSFVVKHNGADVAVADVAKLEYLESETGTWYEFYGDFGPAATGFPLTDATSNFRVTFLKTGAYDVQVFIKPYGAGNDAALCTAAASANVTYPAASFSINGAAVSTDWYNAAQTITVKVDSVVSDACLDVVTVNGTEDTNAWANDGSNNWTKTATLDASGYVTYGSQKQEIKIDTFVPKIEDVDAYQYGGWFSPKQTSVWCKVTVGESRAESITVNGNTIDLTKVDWNENGDGTYSAFVTMQVRGHVNPEITAVSGAGKIGSNLPVESQGPLTVAFTGAAEDTVIGTDADNKIYAPTGFVTITIANATDATGEYELITSGEKCTTVVALDQDGNAITPSEWVFDGINWTSTVSLANGLTKLEVTPVSASPVDESGIRSEETQSFTTVYAMDAVAPVVSITRSAAPAQSVDGVDYYSTPVTYTLSIEDVLLVGKNGVNNTSVVYTINGVASEPVKFENGADVVIPVADGQTLTGIVVTAADASGNVTETVVSDATMTWGEGMSYTCSTVVDTKPAAIELKLSDNVTGLYENSNGWFAVIDEEKGIKVVVTATITDANLDVAAVSAFMTEAGWTAGENGTWTKTLAVADHETGAMDFAFMAKDLTGRFVTTDVILAAGNGGSAIVISAVENAYTVQLKLDRRAPGTGPETAVPEISLALEAPVTTTQVEGNDLYSTAPTFVATIKDISTPRDAEYDDSGLETITWKLTDTDGFVVDAADEVPFEDDSFEHVLSIPVELKTEVGESNSMNLQITVADKSGNKFSFVKTFGVDTQGARIAVAYDNNEAVNDNFYQEVRTATVTAEDINFKEMLVNGTAHTDMTVEVEYTTEGEHTLTVASTDLAGNEATVDFANKTDSKENEHFYIDLTNPVIEVAVTGAAAVNADAQADYHNGEVTYAFTLTDMFMQEVSAKVIFEDGTEQEIVLSPTTTNEKETDMDTYVGSVTFTDGQVVADIVVSALDKSGRESGWTNSADGTATCIVVDMTAPAITVTKTEGSFVQSYKGEGWYKSVDYYNGEIVYTVKVTDKFLHAGVGAAQMIVTYSDGVESVVDMANGIMLAAEGEEETGTPAALLAAEDVYEFEIPVKDGVTLTDIKLLVVDNATNFVNEDKTNLTVVDSEKNAEGNALTAFAYDETTKTWGYTGNLVVVDTVDPVATLTFSDNVKTFFVRNNTVYLELVNPVQEESGVESEVSDESVTVTVGVTDLNLAIDNENEHGVKAAENTSVWNGETLINGESTITYVAQKAQVGPDRTEYFVVDIEVSDLAGNVLKSFKSDVAADKSTYLPVNVSETGTVKYNFSLDRARPNSGLSDTDAPVITIEPTIEPSKTADGKELYSGAFQFKLNVTDGEAAAEGEVDVNSGLQYVKWTVTDKNGVVAEVDITNSYAKGETEEMGSEEAAEEAAEDAAEEAAEPAAPTYSGNYAIDVALAGIAGRQESNEVTVSIEAMDNVGNLITYSKDFGVDAEAPAVTIETEHGLETCNVHEGIGHEYFFNEDQTIRITVTELNFDAAKSIVTSLEVTDNENVAFSGWSNQGGNVWTGSLSYTTDGDYTFDMESTDLAGHAAEIEIDPYVAKFTIDKTAPVIRTDFNPFIAVDTDDKGVQYFDKDRTVTVTIEEHNFRAADVQADLGAANALGYWASMGDTHTASEVFTQGNNYSVKVDYTDLAGNPATGYASPTFSVDLEAPAIEINKGSMSTGTLNIVADDLILGFSVTDFQDNLKNFTVEVIHLDNNYQQTKVQGVEYYTVTDGDRTTGYVDFTNIASEKANDGIYTVRVSALDYAGHTTHYPDVVFSLNRFGSTFTVTDAYTSSFLTADETGTIYQNKVQGNLIITEINPNRVWQDADQTVEGSAITVAANGSSVTLVPGEDYEVVVEQKGTGSNKWYEYTYSINPDVFNNNEELVDGDYTIFFYSEDEAGNKNTNESNVGSALQMGADGNYSGKVSFTLDHKAPVVTVLNIEEGGQYVEANKNVEINIADNTPVSIAVYINDQLVEFVESAEGQALTSDWLTYDAATGNYVLNMSEKDEIQNVRVVVTDAAGNVFEQTIGDITLTENLWIQFVNNEVLVIGTSVGAAGLILLLILLLKRKKKEAAAA